MQNRKIFEVFYKDKSIGYVETYGDESDALNIAQCNIIIRKVK